MSGREGEGGGISKNFYTFDLCNVTDGVSLARSGPDLQNGVAMRHLRAMLGSHLETHG